MIKFFVTGADGQLGKAFQTILPSCESVFFGKKLLDITEQKEVERAVLSWRPQFIIHCAAYTNVDDCEKHPWEAQKINHEGTKNLVLALQKISATLVYISTDFVFDGRKNVSYSENDIPHPLSVYGKTKLAGEQEVQKLKKYLIIRTAWLFGEGKNFVRTILELAKTQKEIPVVKDQIGSPTYALDLAQAIEKLIQRQLTNEKQSGIYHITNSGHCSWYEFAKKIVALKRLETKILPITTAEWQKIKPDSAPRPPYSVLALEKIQKEGIKMRPWQEALAEYLNSL